MLVEFLFLEVFLDFLTGDREIDLDLDLMRFFFLLLRDLERFFFLAVVDTGGGEPDKGRLSLRLGDLDLRDHLIGDLVPDLD